MGLLKKKSRPGNPAADNVKSAEEEENPSDGKVWNMRAVRFDQVRVNNVDDEGTDEGYTTQEKFGVGYREPLCNFEEDDIAGQDYISVPARTAKAFVSHCWSSDEDDPRLYAACKVKALWRAIVMCLQGDGIAIPHDKPHIAECTLWMDKFCINQTDEAEKLRGVMSLEAYISRCDYVIVACSKRYFTRLWCVYELACFFATKPFNTIKMDTIESSEGNLLITEFIDPIKAITVESLNCYHEADKEVLRRKVAEYYYGEEEFTTFAQICGILKVFEGACSQSCFGSMVKDVESQEKGDGGMDDMVKYLYEDTGPCIEAVGGFGINVQPLRAMVEELKDLMRSWTTTTPDFGPIIMVEDCDRVMAKGLVNHIAPIVEKQRSQYCRPGLLAI